MMMLANSNGAPFIAFLYEKTLLPSLFYSPLIPLFFMHTMLRKILPAFLFSSKHAELEPEGVAFNTKSVYDTCFGRVTLTWSRTSLIAPSVTTEILFAEPAATGADSISSVPTDGTRSNISQPFSFEISPTCPDQVRGLKRIQFMKQSTPGIREQFCNATFAWDFSRSLCRVPGSAQPSSCYYFAIVIDDEMLLLFGDMQERAHMLTEARKGPEAVPISREDKVHMKGNTYNTSAAFGGVEREISINLPHGVSARMSVQIDGRKVVEVKTLQNLFRGSYKMDLPDGHLLHITWDLHDWLFKSAEVGVEPAVAPEKEDGLFTFSFAEQEANFERRTCPGDDVDVLHQEGDALMSTRYMEEWISPEEERMYKGETYRFAIYLWKS